MRTRLALFLILVSPLGATAQPKTALTVAPPGRMDNLISVTAPHARCVALSERLQLLAFGHDRGYLDAHVSLVKLDAKGQPAAYAVPIKLPRVDTLAAKYPGYTLSVAFHPKLPLLYVWQDITIVYTNPPPPPPPDWDKYNHLHIVSMAKDVPEVVASMCRGVEYIYGQKGGALAVDAEGSYLYVPNLREVKNAGSLRFGRFPLDADGLPVVPEIDAKQPPALRAKRLTDLNAAKPVLPPQLTPIEYVQLFNLTGFGCGLSFHPVSKDEVIAGGSQGLIAWRPDDKVSTVSGLPLRVAGHTLLTVHPNLPLVFATSHHKTQPDSLFRVGLVEGYLTLLPQQYVLPGTDLTSVPVVLSKSNAVAVGGHYFVYVVRLDVQGVPQPDVQRYQVFCPAVHALVYSEKFDRLYVGVELSK